MKNFPIYSRRFSLTPFTRSSSEQIWAEKSKVASSLVPLSGKIGKASKSGNILEQLNNIGNLETVSTTLYHILPREKAEPAKNIHRLTIVFPQNHLW